LPISLVVSPFSMKKETLGYSVTVKAMKGLSRQKVKKIDPN